MLLDDREWFQKSNAEIGRHCGLSAPTVSSIRDHFVNEEARKSAVSSGAIKNSLIDKRKRTDKDGKTVSFKPQPGRKPRTQAEKNLADLNGALDTLARLPFTASFAVETYGSLITDNAGAALEWLAELGEAMRCA